MSVERDELHRRVDGLPEEQVSDALADARRHLAPTASRPWPPPWFGSATASRKDTAARADELLAEGFGRSV